ncbi:MAG: RNA-binding S4 domain-containing protein [Planctomycetota bacterium]
MADFLKWTGWCDTGGQAKAVIQAGEVCVNGQIETRRRRQLFDGDRVRFGGQEAVVDDKL